MIRARDDAIAQFELRAITMLQPVNDHLSFDPPKVFYPNTAEVGAELGMLFAVQRPAGAPLGSGTPVLIKGPGSAQPNMKIDFTVAISLIDAGPASNLVATDALRDCNRFARKVVSSLSPFIT